MFTDSRGFLVCDTASGEWVAPGDSCAHDSAMSDLSITFTSAELAELRKWVRLAYGAEQQDPALVAKIERAYQHSRAPAHPPELSAAGSMPFWCVVRADSPESRAEVQHWTAHRVDPQES